MYAALHGFPGYTPISLDEALDLREIQTVGASWKNATNRNQADAAQAAARRRSQGGG